MRRGYLAGIESVWRSRCRCADIPEWHDEEYQANCTQVWKAVGTSLSSSEESIETVGLGSEKSTESSEKILELIKQNPKISAAGIAMEIGISSRGVEKQIKKLREAGIIKRNGADRGAIGKS